MATRPRPLNGLLIIRRDPEETMMGSLVIPDNSKEKLQRGSVLYASEYILTANGQQLPLTVKVGDSVVFGKWSGTEQKINGEELVVIPEAEIHYIDEEVEEEIPVNE